MKARHVMCQRLGTAWACDLTNNNNNYGHVMYPTSETAKVEYLKRQFPFFSLYRNFDLMILLS